MRLMGTCRQYTLAFAFCLYATLLCSTYVCIPIVTGNTAGTSKAMESARKTPNCCDKWEDAPYDVDLRFVSVITQSDEPSYQT